MKNCKILITGVGGQGIVFLTNIIVEAAMLCETEVDVSEIHGLSQRGGVVTSGIGLGKNCTGTTGKANVDFLIGLEALETQRCLPLLHKKSSVVFCNYKIAPYLVNAELAEYPGTDEFTAYITSQCEEVVFVKEFPEAIDPLHYNLFLLGTATGMKKFMFKSGIIEKAIQKVVSDSQLERSLTAFRAGFNYKLSVSVNY
jgi:indolepyruvate ferredoxin oxidoreductase, beta subunit